MQVAVGIFGVGFLVFTLMFKVAMPMMLGEFNIDHLPWDLDEKEAIDGTTATEAGASA